MADHLEPPTEELKLIGTPRIEETDQSVYSVHIELSRKLTLPEQDAVKGSSGAPPRSPAGWVKIAADMRHLTVTETTIEKVAQHRDSLREIVSKIAAEGEEYRKRAVEARRQAAEEGEGRQAERVRRTNLANEIKFD
jgi:hypothetical protein